MKRIALIVIRVIWRLPYWWGYKAVSYTHLDVYKRQILIFVIIILIVLNLGKIYNYKH